MTKEETIKEICKLAKEIGVKIQFKPKLKPVQGFLENKIVNLQPNFSSREEINLETEQFCEEIDKFGLDSFSLTVTSEPLKEIKFEDLK